MNIKSVKINHISVAVIAYNSRKVKPTMVSLIWFVPNHLYYLAWENQFFFIVLIGVGANALFDPIHNNKNNEDKAMRKTIVSEFDFLKLYGKQDAAVAFYEGLRWPNGRRCVHCGCSETY